MISLELRALTSLARLQHATQGRAPIEGELATALTRLEKGGTTFDQQDARRVLDAIRSDKASGHV